MNEKQISASNTAPAQTSIQSSAQSSAKSSVQPLGQVYQWYPLAVCAQVESAVGRIEMATVPLERLVSPHHLSGRFVRVHNASATLLPGAVSKDPIPLSDARADGDGNFLFEPHHGGGRVEKFPFADPDRWQRYISASRFGEVNAYYHIDKVAHYVDGLLHELGFPSLPPVVVKVNAHNAVSRGGQNGACCDGVQGRKSKRWLPFQGGHYRLPTAKKMTVVEHQSISPSGEIHLGPGWKLTEFGALADRVKKKYRCNASHNVGTLYHEYGHHLTRHTADFRGNRLKSPQRQCNFKTEVDEAYCDYLAATLMDSPHIWAFHHLHDNQSVHCRSLVSQNTMDDFDHRRDADPHDNGTILAAALWDLRQAIVEDRLNSDDSTVAVDADHAERKFVRQVDLLIINSLILLGQLFDHPTAPKSKPTRILRRSYDTVLDAILESDRRLFDGAHLGIIERCFGKRKIVSRASESNPRLWTVPSAPVIVLPLDHPDLQKIQRKDPTGIVPQSAELMSAEQLQQNLDSRTAGPYSVMTVGDVMIGSRARNRTNEFGPDYIFQSVAPLFRRSSIVLGNQEGPIARNAKKRPRNYSYRVSPDYTRVLRRAGFNVLTLANNHLLDCGREGVLETLKSLSKHQIQAIGCGRDRDAAHAPAILQAGPHRIGLLGYYWNRRTSACRNKPGSARDTPQRLAADIEKLRPLVDRIVVTVHWGVPYEREPSYADREKARLMISLGADVVIGHHPHVMQGVEIIDDRPVIYSIGNFAFGTGNSKAESLAVGVQFSDTQTIVDFYPAYVKNRDPRVNYQPKIMTGAAAEKALHRLAKLSSDGSLIKIENGVGQLRLPFSSREFTVSKRETPVVVH